MFLSFWPRIPFERWQYPAGKSGLERYKEDMDKAVREEFKNYEQQCKKNLDDVLRREKAFMEERLTEMKARLDSNEISFSGPDGAANILPTGG